MPFRRPLVAAVTVAGLVAVPASAPAHESGLARRAGPSIRALVGQKLVVSMDDTTPSASLLRRARRGKIGGVIIHGSNFSTAAQLGAITAKLRTAARAGGRPRLLIAVDQEGGPVKTVPWAPPTISPRRMGELDSTTIAARQGRRTGKALRALGIDVDFAPVADVPSSTSSFMYLRGRTWSFGARRTARLSTAFAAGLGDRNVAATMKHFPGLGRARRNTDTNVVHIRASKARLAAGLRPYRRAIARGAVPLVMLSNAVYTAYDRTHAAGWSRVIGKTLLRGTLGFRGVTITDSLTGTAGARGISDVELALRAARAGTDMILVTGSESSTRAVYRALENAASAGTIDNARLLASFSRMKALKAWLL